MPAILKDAKIVFDPSEGRAARIIGYDVNSGKVHNYKTNFFIYPDGITRGRSGSFATVLIPTPLFSSNAVITQFFSPEDMEKLAEIVGGKPYIAVGKDSDGRILYAAPVEAKVEVQKKPKEPLADLKAYETPLKAKEELIYSIYFPYVLETVSRLAYYGVLEEAKNLKRDVRLAVETAEEGSLKEGTRAYYLYSLAKWAEKLNCTPIGGHYAYDEDAVRECSVQPAPPEEVIRFIAKEYPEVAKKLRVCFVDPQAGSGDHAKIIERWGNGSLLTGLEIRDESIKVNSPANQVKYGVNFVYAAREFEQRGKESVSLQSSFYFVNPPFSADRFFERKTIDAVPEGAPIVGIMPKDALGYMKKHVKGVYAEVPAEMLGYDPKKVPSVLIFVGRKDRYGEMEEVPLKDSVFDTLAPFASFFVRYVPYEKASSLAVKVPQIMDTIAAAAEHLEKEAEQLAEEYSLENYTLKERIKKGDRVIPDMRFYGEKPLKSIYQVVGNVTLLSYYKEVYPAFYRDLVKMAKELDIPVAEIPERGVEYVTTDNLGIMKYKYLPKKVEMTDDVWRALEFVVTNAEAGKTEDAEKVEKLKKTGVVKSAAVKIELAQKSFGGESVIGYTPILALLDSLDREVACFRIDVAKFYDALLSSGAVELNCRTANPDEEIKLKMIVNFLKHLLWIQRESDFSPRRHLKEVSDLMKEIKEEKDEEKRKELKKELGRILRVAATEESKLFEKFFSPYAVVISPEKEVHKRLTEMLSSRGIKVPSSKVRKLVKDVVSVYKKSPYRFFFLEKEEAEKVVSELAEKFVKDAGIENRPGIKNDVVSAVWDGLAQHYTVFDKVLDGAAALTLALYMKEYARYYLTEFGRDGIDKAWSTFNMIMLDVFKVKKHQLLEALRLAVKAEKTGEPGHLLGWEMRSGKTLTMVLSGYFNYLMNGSDIYLFPRTGNVNDILMQTIAHVPAVVPHLAVYDVSTTEIYAPEKDTLNVPTEREQIFPNLLRVISTYKDKKLKEFIIGGGDKVDELLSAYTLEMEELIKIAEEKLRSSSPEELIDERFSFFLESPYTDAVNVACAWYFERLEKRGLLNLSILPAYEEAFRKHAETVSQMLSQDEEKGVHKPLFTFRIISKSRIPFFNFTVEKAEKTVPLSQYSKLRMRNNYQLRSVSDTQAVSVGNVENPEEWIIGNADYLKGRLKGVLAERKLPEEYVEYFDFEEIEVGEVNSIPIVAYRIKVKDDAPADLLEKELTPEKLAGLIGERSYSACTLKEALEWVNGTLKKLAEGDKKEAEGLIRKFTYRVTEQFKFNDYLKSLKLKCSVNAVPVQRANGAEFCGLFVERIDEEAPTSVNSERVVPNGEVTFIFKGVNENLSSAEIVLEKNHEHPAVLISNSSNQSAYFIRENALEEERPAVIVDEIDESTTVSSNTYLATYSLAKKASLRLGATGTPTSGYPETVMALMGVVSGFPYDTIVSSIGEIVENFSTYSVKKNTVGGIFASAVLTLPPETGEKLVSLVNSTTPQEFLLMLKAVLEEEDPLLAAELKNLFNTYKTEELYNQVKVLYRDIELAEKRACVEFTASNAPYFFGTYLTKYVKRTPGTFDPVGFVSSLQGASVSFNTRENLKKEFLGKEVKEKVEFDVKQALEILNSFKISGRAVIKEGSEFATGTENLRAYFDKMLPEEKEKTANAFESILSLADALKKEIQKNPQAFASRYGLDPKEVKTKAGKTLKSLNDDLPTLMKEYLYANQDIEVIREKYPEKAELFSAFLKEIASTLSSASNLSEKDGITTVKTPCYTLKVKGVLSPVSVSIGNDEVPLFVKPNGELMEFSRTLKVSSPLWRILEEEGITEEKPALSVKLEFFNDRNAEMVDALTNAGYEEKTYELTSQGKSFLLTSCRVLPLVARFYDVLSCAVGQRKEGVLPYHTQVLVRITSEEMKKAVESLNREKLERIGIFVKAFTDNASLDMESQKWKKAMSKGEKVQVVVVAPDETIARGVDLSHLDEIVYAGVSRSGKTATQLFARIFSVERHEGRINMFGKPLAYWGDKLAPSFQLPLTMNTFEKYRFIKEVMSGELASVAEEYAKTAGLVELSPTIKLDDGGFDPDK